MTIELKIRKEIENIKNGHIDLKMSIMNISKLANVSRQTIYNYPEIVKEIKEYKANINCNCNHLTLQLKKENELLKKELFYLKKNKFEF